MISLIAAVGKNYEIGYKNNLIWKIKSDLKFFKEITTNNIVVMGRKTYDSISKPLPNRKNIVLTKNKNLKIDGVETFQNPSEIIEKYRNENVFIIGGESIYKLFLNLADQIILTEIDSEFSKADTYFPKFDKSKFEITSSKYFHGDDINFKQVVYSRKNNGQ